MRHCNKCDTEKSDTDFSPQTWWCKSCTRIASKERYHKRRLNIASRDDEYIKKYKRQTMCARAKLRARERNVPFDIVPDDIIIPTYCPILGIVINIRADKTSVAGSPALDRLIPELGYVKGNINVISQRANTLKSNTTLEESQLLTAWLQFRVGDIKW